MGCSWFFNKSLDTSRIYRLQSGCLGNECLFLPWRTCGRQGLDEHPSSLAPVYATLSLQLHADDLSTTRDGYTPFQRLGLCHQIRISRSWCWWKRTPGPLPIAFGNQRPDAKSKTLQSGDRTPGMTCPGATQSQPIAWGASNTKHTCSKSSRRGERSVQARRASAQEHFNWQQPAGKSTSAGCFEDNKSGPCEAGTLPGWPRRARATAARVQRGSVIGGTRDRLISSETLWLAWD